MSIMPNNNRYKSAVVKRITLITGKFVPFLFWVILTVILSFFQPNEVVAKPQSNKLLTQKSPRFFCSFCCCLEIMPTCLSVGCTAWKKVTQRNASQSSWESFGGKIFNYKLFITSTAEIKAVSEISFRASGGHWWIEVRLENGVELSS